MFSNTAYEALYKYLGLMLHSGSIEIITSEPFFKGLVLILFGGLFLLTAWKFTARNIMGNLVKRYNVPISQFVKIILCLVLGVSILRIGTQAQIKAFGGNSWNENHYVKTRLNNVNRNYKVSFIFDIMSRTAEEISRYVSEVGEYIFGDKEDSYLKGPHGYAKAIMLAGSATIDDPVLQKKVDSYTRNCIMRIYSQVKKKSENVNLGGYYKGNVWIDGMLQKIPLAKNSSGGDFTCRDLKDDLRSHLRSNATKKSFAVNSILHDPQKRIVHTNVTVSSMLNNHYKENKEGYWGIHKGSNPPGTTGTAFQYLNKFFSWDTVLSVFGRSDLHGASEAAKRAEKFSELLKRAPHIKGICQMILIGIFPWLIFFIVAGKWKVLISWFWIYFSVCMWTPIWTIMYHVMNHISENADVLHDFGMLSDGVSLYASNLIMERIYYSYSVFTFAQTLVPFVTTGAVVYFLKPMLSDSESETAPEFIDDAKGAASNVAGVATGLPISGGGTKGA